MSSVRILCCLLGIWACGVLHAEPIRLAIISGPETRGVADFLTLLLSSESSVALLERDQIDKVLNEQKLFLGGFDFQGTLKAGQLLRADGIVCITSSERSNASSDKPHKTMKCQLIAVNPGVMLWSRPVDVTDFKPSKAPELASQLGGAII